MESVKAIFVHGIRALDTSDKSWLLVGQYQVPAETTNKCYSSAQQEQEVIELIKLARNWRGFNIRVMCNLDLHKLYTTS